MTSSFSSPWPPYKDCSQETCSIYCPQRCLLFPPPPPPSFDLDDYDSGGPDFSPLIIALIGILASAFIFICYYTIISRFCRRRRNDTSSSSSTYQLNENDGFCPTTSAGLDEASIKSATVCCKYKKGDLVEGTECSVCLNEFQEDESLRLLPKCNHAFHLPCIDTWFKSHSSCPLCRANIAAAAVPVPVPDHHQSQQSQPSQQQNVSATSSALQHASRRRNDVILVIQDHHHHHHHHINQTVVYVGQELDTVVDARVNAPNMPEDSRLSIADILRIEDELEEEEEQEEEGRARSPI